MGKYLLPRRPGNRKSTSNSLLWDKLFCGREQALPAGSGGGRRGGGCSAHLLPPPLPGARVPQSLRAPRRAVSCLGGALRGAEKEARSCSHTCIAFGLSSDRKVSFRSSLLGSFVAIKSLSNLALKTQGGKKDKGKKKKKRPIIKQSKKLNLSYSGAPRREFAISCKIPCELMT